MKVGTFAAIAAAVAVATLTAPTAHADFLGIVNDDVNRLEGAICLARMSGHQWPEIIDSLTGKNGVDHSQWRGIGTMTTRLDTNTALLLIKASVETLCPQETG